MRGYVRRKITYNLGKGGSPNTRQSEPNANRAIPRINPRHWFLDPPEDVTEYAIIVDSSGTYYIDEEYRALGVREGWLILYRMYQNEARENVLQYRLRSPPE